MKRVKRLMSVRKQKDEEDNSNRNGQGNEKKKPFDSPETSPVTKSVNFFVGDAGESTHKSATPPPPGPSRRPSAQQSQDRRPRRVNLQRTLSRSVECLKSAEARPVFKRSILRQPAPYQHSDSDSSINSRTGLTGGGGGEWSRTHSYYGFRPGLSHMTQAAANTSGANSSSSSLRSRYRTPPSGVPAYKMGMCRCGSSPPTSGGGGVIAGRSSAAAAAAAAAVDVGRRGSLSNIHGPGRLQGYDMILPWSPSGDFANASDFRSAINLNLLPSSVTAKLHQQSEENLFLDLQRKQEKNWMNTSRMREETSILKNIKKREMIEMKKKEVVKVLSKDRKDDKKHSSSTSSSTFPLGGVAAIMQLPPLVSRNIPSAASFSFLSSATLAKKSCNSNKDVASGLLMCNSSIMLAPAAAALIDPSAAARGAAESAAAKAVAAVASIMAAGMMEDAAGVAPAEAEKQKLKEWVPPPPPTQQKPRERQLVRKFLQAMIHHTEEDAPSVTKFVESEFALECLRWHNHYRRKHCSPPLVIDEQLCASAQYWSNILAHRDELFHEMQQSQPPFAASPPPPPVGENLFAWPLPVMASTSTAKRSPDITGRDVAVYWYKKMRNYYFRKDPSVLHAHAAQFSQMVWASSQKFGCGKARSRSGKVIVVAHYYPRGNVVGQFHLNVFPAKEEDEDESDEFKDDG